MTDEFDSDSTPICGVCYGEGWVLYQGLGEVDCPHCGGSGLLPLLDDSDDDQVPF